MKKINYVWDEANNSSLDIESEELPGRKDIQIARRLFHMANGSIIATLYWLSFSHQQAVHLLGTFACLLYVFEQIRINYPEMASRFIPMTKFIIRAEEQLKESAMVPYAFAVLLTMITFPKPIALIAIYTLAISDPMSALVGIKYGRRRIVAHKTLEGSAAFFVTAFLICLFILNIALPGKIGLVVFISFLVTVITTAFEMIPLKIDDNLTIPLFTSFCLWVVCSFCGIYF